MTSVLAAELDLENLLLRIPRVLGARVRLGPSGSVDGIHLLVAGKESPGGLAFEVERLLEEQRALRLDPGVISVATLAPSRSRSGVRREPSGGEPLRFEFRRLSFESASDLKVRVSVELGLEQVILRGEACETDVPRARPALAGRAVLNALDFLRERGVAFYLEGVEFLAGFHAPVALALIHALSLGRKRALTGCALVAGSREEAAARATLAAINRFYGALRVPAER